MPGLWSHERGMYRRSTSPRTSLRCAKSPASLISHSSPRTNSPSRPTYTVPGIAVSFPHQSSGMRCLRWSMYTARLAAGSNLPPMRMGIAFSMRPAKDRPSRRSVSTCKSPWVTRKSPYTWCETTLAPLICGATLQSTSQGTHSICVASFGLAPSTAFATVSSETCPDAAKRNRSSNWRRTPSRSLSVGMYTKNLLIGWERLAEKAPLCKRFLDKQIFVHSLYYPKSCLKEC